MKVLGICGSPQRGNTYQMLEWVLDSAKKHGAQTKLVELMDYDLEWCRGCGVCYDSPNPCVIEDKMRALEDLMKDANAIIIGSPNYFNNVPGLLKNFIDRTNSICHPGQVIGKVGASVVVGYRDKEEHKVVSRYLKEYMRIMQLEYAGTVIARAENPGDLNDQTDVRQECHDLGKRIIKALTSDPQPKR